MNWKELAPWITIAITLILSIITPLLTQIANNRFKIKQNKQEQKNKIERDKVHTYYEFAENVGACVAFSDYEEVKSAGAVIQKMYLIMPETYWEQLDNLYSLIRKHDWDEAEIVLRELCKAAATIITENN